MSKLYNVQFSSAYASSFLIHHLSIGFPPPPIVHSLCKRIKNIKRVSKKAILTSSSNSENYCNGYFTYVSQSTTNFRTPKTQKETILASSFRTTFVQSSPKPEQKEGVVLDRP